MEVQKADGSYVFGIWYSPAEAGCGSGAECVVLPSPALTLPNGQYQWHILDYGTYGYGSWTGFHQFTPPTVAELGSPSGGVTAGTTRSTGRE